MPFVSDITEYEDAATAVMRSELQYVADELMVERYKGYTQLLLEWVATVYPRCLKMFIQPYGAPTINNFISSQIRYDRRQERKMNQAARGAWPNSGVPKDWYIDTPEANAEFKKLLKETEVQRPRFYKGPPNKYEGMFCTSTTTTYIVPGGRTPIPQEIAELYEHNAKSTEVTDAVRDAAKYVMEKARPLLISAMRPYLPWELRPDQIEATEYHEECNRLQATKAGQKARQLLLDNLTDAQRTDYFKRGFFLVTPKSNATLQSKVTRFAIVTGFPNGNIYELRNRQILGDWCFHPGDAYPLDDIYLAQKLMVEENEEELRKVGNFSSLAQLGNRSSVIERQIQAAIP